MIKVVVTPMTIVMAKSQHYLAHTFCEKGRVSNAWVIAILRLFRSAQFVDNKNSLALRAQGVGWDD
jgi:hypothetical protein